MNLPDQASALFELPPEEFTAGRDRLAAELKAESPEDAKAVKALKRPSVAAYALNRVSRKEPETVERLLEADESLRTAKSKKDMEAAKESRRKAIAAITGAAAKLLDSEGRPVAAQIKEKITETLLAVATDEEARTLLSEGRLTKEVSPGGFGPAAALDLQPDAEPAAEVSSPARQRGEKLRREAEALMGEAKELRVKADDLRAAANQTLKEAEQAADRADKAEALAKQKLDKAEEG